MIRVLTAVALILVMSVSAMAQNDSQNQQSQQTGQNQQIEEEREKNRITVALSVGGYFPTSGETRDRFKSVLWRANLTTLDAKRPQEWRFTSEAGGYRFNGPTDLRLYHMTFGAIRGLGEQTSAQPYVAVRGGPYYGKISEDGGGLNESKWGLNLNAALGVVLQRTFYVEARYDYFSKLGGVNLNGLSLTAGFRLFDIDL